MGFFDPMGMSKDGDVTAFRRLGKGSALCAAFAPFGVERAASLQARMQGSFHPSKQRAGVVATDCWAQAHLATTRANYPLIF